MLIELASTFPILGGGELHQPEPKCHIDLRIQLFQSCGGWGTSEVTRNCFNFSNPGVGGKVHQPEPKCHIDLRFQLLHSWRGVHQAELKCHIDLRFQLFQSWGAYIGSHLNLLQLFQSWGGHQPEPKCHVDLRFQLFQSWGGGVHQKSLELASTFPILGWGYIGSRSNLLQLFQSWGGGMSAGRSEKCKVYG